MLYSNVESIDLMGNIHIKGYTIVELLIFVAISGALLTSALLMVGGQRGRTEFATSVRQFEVLLQDVINDVATGYYPSDGSFSCTVNPVGGALSLSQLTTEDRGKNADCLFVGTVIQFGVDGGDDNTITTYPVAGRRLNGTENVSSLTEANAQLIYNGSLDLSRDFSTGAAVAQDVSGVGGIGIFANFKAGGGDPGAQEARTANYALIPATMTGMNRPNFVSAANGFLAANPDASLNPGALTMCLNSLASEQKANVTITSSAGGLSVSSIIQEGSC